MTRPGETAGKVLAFLGARTPLTKVFPSMKTPTGRLGLSSRARLVWTRRAIVSRPWRWPMTRFSTPCNRLVVVPYYPISKETLKTIIGLNLRKVERRVRENHNVPFTYDPAVPELIAQRCTELERGARLVDAIVTNQLLPDVGREFLSRLADGRAVKRIHLTAVNGDFAYEFD